MKLYVGNLSYEVTDQDLMQAFSAFGKVDSAVVVKDMYTKKSKGFGFVEMPAKAEADAAVAELQGQELKGRPINVNEARQDTGRRTGGPGGGNRGRGGDGGWRGSSGGNRGW